MHLNISGKNNREQTTIDSLGYLKIHKDYVSIENEVETLQLRLNKIGYIENYFDDIKKNNDSTFTALINLNKKYHTIYIYYNKESVSKTILNQISNDVNDNYFVLSINNVENALNFINSKIAEQGLPFNYLKLSNISIKSNRDLKASLVVSEKIKERTIDNVIVKGYKGFSKSYLKHFLKIKSRELFNLEAIKQKTNLLENLNFANQIKPPEVLFTKDSTTLYLYIEKAKSNNFDGFLGFGTNEETNKLEFNGYLNLNLVNNLNYGESFELEYKSTVSEQKIFNAKLNTPYLFATSIGSEVELNIFKKDSSFTTVDQIARLYYQLSTRSKVFAGVSSIKSNNLLSNTSTTNVQGYNSLFYNVRYQYINRQNLSNLFTTNFLFDLEAGFGKRDFEESSKKTNQSYF